jgi:hypothetical protein
MAGFRGLLMFRVPYLYLMFSLYVFLTCIGFGTFLYISKALVITAHKQKPKSLAKANAICAFAYLQNVIKH